MMQASSQLDGLVLDGLPPCGNRWLTTAVIAGAMIVGRAELGKTRFQLPRKLA
jgi:hypothetical protein